MKRAVQNMLCFGTLLCAADLAFGDCAAPRFITPAERITSDTRPGIRWSAVDGATAYALKVQSRVPEGRVVASFDVVITDTQFVPPTVLADERAKVTVSVTARCTDGVSALGSAWFLIDATVNCPSPLGVRIKFENGRAVVDWSAAAGAALYEVRLHSPLDGRVLKVVEAREARATLEGDLPDGAVLSVRPRCAHAFGEAAFGIVTN